MSKYRDIHIAKPITYIGIDESTLGVGNGSIIIVAAETDNSELAKEKGFQFFSKAKNYLENSKQFPNLEYMFNQGLKEFYWMRANQGRFNRQQITLAGIGQLIQANGHNPNSTVLLIDAFHSKHHETKYLIKEYLVGNGFNIPEQNIEIIAGGDRSVEIINFADLLAFQIGYNKEQEHKDHNPNAIELDVLTHEIPFDEQRTEPISEKGREILEDLLKP